MLLLLLPGSIMANSPPGNCTIQAIPRMRFTEIYRAVSERLLVFPASHWPNAAGYGFVFVLWCSGWVFMWVQGKGVRTQAFPTQLDFILSRM